MIYQPILQCLLFSLVHIKEVLSIDLVASRGNLLDDSLLARRQLKAATRSHEVNSRDVKGCLRYDHRLHYVDDLLSHQLLQNSNGYLPGPSDVRRPASNFVATAGMEFKVPALLLENIDHNIANIECFDSKIRLHFYSAETYQHACEEFNEVHSFMLITSHSGCNKDGERDAHR